MATTIQIQDSTKGKLDKLKEYARETYDELINDLITFKEEDSMELSAKTKAAIKHGREDIKKGRFYTTEQLIKELGI